MVYNLNYLLRTQQLPKDWRNVSRGKPPKKVLEMKTPQSPQVILIKNATHWPARKTCVCRKL